MMYDGTSGGALMIQIIIEKCGDSPVFKIPEAIMEKVGFSIGDAIDIEVKNGCIIIGHWIRVWSTKIGNPCTLNSLYGSCSELTHNPVSI
jgi:hypothetical protein